MGREELGGPRAGSVLAAAHAHLRPSTTLGTTYSLADEVGRRRCRSRHAGGAAELEDACKTRPAAGMRVDALDETRELTSD